jgi:hypothetical protein
MGKNAVMPIWRCKIHRSARGGKVRLDCTGAHVPTRGLHVPRVASVAGGLELRHADAIDTSRGTQVSGCRAPLRIFSLQPPTRIDQGFPGHGAHGEAGVG